jgi:LysR family glycine cleavage system transcriptional activator
MKIKPLPPLKSLVAFESAARHLNFTQAGDELSVTQGAVSKQIRLLEDYLGQTLFVRSKRNLILSDLGKRYSESIRHALTGIAGATADAIEWQQSGHITIATTSGLAALWLMPKFVAFEAEYPSIDVRIKIVKSIERARNYDFDIGLFHCLERPSGYQSIPLFGESVFPVCSPQFLKDHPEVKDPINLSQAKLLVLDEEPWVSWDEWLDKCELPKPSKQANKTVINEYPLLIQAAINGQGLALAWEKMLDQHLAAGQLVIPNDTKVTTEARFFFVMPEQQPIKLPTQNFIDFIQQLPE